jgi:hypothetical protein
LKPTPAALSEVFNEAQSKIVWDAAAEAAGDLVRLAKNSTPQSFTDAQSKADAMTMFRRFIVKDLASKIPPRLRTKKDPTVLPKVVVTAPDAAKIKPFPKPKLPKVDPGLIPKRPRLPKFEGLGLLLLGLILLSEDDD